MISSRQNRNDRYQDSYQRRDYRGPRDNDYRDRNQRDGEYRDRNQRDGDFRDRGQNNGLKEDHRMQRQGSHDRRDPDNRRESFPVSIFFLIKLLLCKFVAACVILNYYGI